MTNDLKICLETICNFPTIYKRGDKSPFIILGQSGYADIFDQVNEDEIFRYIENKIDIVEEWIQYSDDIRHSPAWAFQNNSKSKWTVLYNDNGKAKTTFTFDNPFNACAKMIKVTMDEIRTG